MGRRMSEGVSIILPPVDKPERPHSLKLDEKANRSVTLTWSPGDDNNSPVFGNSLVALTRITVTTN